MSDVRMSWDKQTAKKLLSALQKGTFDKLTKAEGDALEDFMFQFQCSVMEAKTGRQSPWDH